MKKSKHRKSKAKIRKIVKRKTTIRAAPRTTKRPRRVERKPPQPAADAPPLPSGPMNQAASIAPDPIDVNR